MFVVALYMEFTLQVLRPLPPECSRPPNPAGVGKNSRRQVRRVRAANPEKAVAVWAGDETQAQADYTSRPVAPGSRPRSSGWPKREWLCVYAPPPPPIGATFTAILSRVNVERMAGALAAFAAHAGPDGTKVLVVAVGNDGWHTARRLAVPANVRLPSLTP